MNEPSTDGGTCCGCGAVTTDRPPTWSLQVGPRGREWLCEACTRDNVRSIEGKLEQGWW